MSQLITMQDENLPILLPRLAVRRSHFLHIADALKAAVVNRSLKPGDRPAPQRLLAAQLDIYLTTITPAYDEARCRTLLESRGARGTYVAAPKVELTSNLDLSMNSRVAQRRLSVVSGRSFINRMTGSSRNYLI